MNEKGVLTARVEAYLAELADNLVKLKGIWEAFDGPAFHFVFKNVDDTLGEKLPEPYKSTLRTALDEIFMEKSYEVACQRLADLSDLLIDIPGLDDETEKGVFKGIFIALASLMAQAGTEKDGTTEV